MKRTFNCCSSIIPLFSAAFVSELLVDNFMPNFQCFIRGESYSNI